jgi:hypothetical protein
MRRVAVLLVALVALLAAGAQLFLPTYLEGRVEDRLEQHGGSADVSLRALSAERLLFDHGDSLKVEGHGLRLRLGGQGRVLERLDGFDEVNMRLHRLSAPPLAVSSFVLRRPDSQSDYTVRMTGSTTPRDVARFLGSQAAGGLGGLAGGLAAQALPAGGRTRIPLDVDARIRSHHGRSHVVSARGSVAGVSASPLVELVLDAVVARL